MASTQPETAQPTHLPRKRVGVPSGERHPLAKLTEATVREMRQWYAEGNIGYLPLASHYGISASTCRDAVTRKTWKHVPEAPTKECGHCCGSGRVPL